MFDLCVFHTEFYTVQATHHCLMASTCKPPTSSRNLFFLEVKKRFPLRYRNCRLKQKPDRRTLVLSGSLSLSSLSPSLSLPSCNPKCITGGTLFCDVGFWSLAPKGPQKLLCLFLSFFISFFQIFDWTSCHKINLKFQKKMGINGMTSCVLPFFSGCNFLSKCEK